MVAADGGADPGTPGRRRPGGRCREARHPCNGRGVQYGPGYRVKNPGMRWHPANRPLTSTGRTTKRPRLLGGWSARTASPGCCGPRPSRRGRRRRRLFSPPAARGRRSVIAATTAKPRSPRLSRGTSRSPCLAREGRRRWSGGTKPGGAIVSPQGRSRSGRHPWPGMRRSFGARLGDLRSAPGRSRAERAWFSRPGSCATGIGTPQGDRAMPSASTLRHRIPRGAGAGVVGPPGAPPILPRRAARVVVPRPAPSWHRQRASPGGSLRKPAGRLQRR
jgi:hypothetical protein